FKKELIPAPLPNDVHSYQFRIHAYDQDGKLVAANITGVPVNTSYTVSQYPWLGALNPAQPDGVRSWVFQLFGFGEFTSPENRLVTNGPGATSASAAEGGGLWYRRNFPGLYRKRFGYYSPFAKYPGEPKDRYSGDYRDYGIPPGTYTIVAEAWYPDYPGRYIQLSTVTSTVTCKGRSTVVFELDLLGRISGSVYTRNWMGDFRSGSWLTNTMTGADNTWVADTPVDGEYEEWVRPGTYTVTMSLQPPGGEAGYRSQTRMAVTTWGGETSGQDFYLEESGIPIPEFPAAGILAAASAMAGVVVLLQRQRGYSAIRHTR
ncbi:carboxypeptidase regulatory-like domain-containing protein, partial [Candidatus Bathyarchaeota archaeon]|nr:carboxypeptidase regulatory-like domain-containing protein [Candidatus Bathyarchaeota archaeon]